MKRWIWLPAWLALGCGGSALPTAASALDVIASSVDTVAQWVHVAQGAAGVVQDVGDRLARAKREKEAGDLLSAANTLWALAQDYKAAGLNPPQNVEAANDLLGQLCATAIEQGMRAASGRNPDGSPKP